jgi:anti-sigma B factor antagonist
MPTEGETLFETEDAQGVTVVRIVQSDLRQPDEAVDLGDQISNLIASGGKRLVIDFHRVGYLGSTGFATLLVLARKAAQGGGQLKLCGLQPEVRFGADILGIGSLIEIYDDSSSAVASF